MGVEGSPEGYLEYTKEWLERVNRGGLFKVHDRIYSFFVSLEMKVRRHLPFLFSSQALSKQSVVDDIVQDDDTLFHWAIAADVEDDILSCELLQHVVKLYLTIRGFSATGACMEHYKQCKISGLRKGLKRTYAYTNTADTT